jgi:hypothetical protein
MNPAGFVGSLPLLEVTPDACQERETNERHQVQAPVVRSRAEFGNEQSGETGGRQENALSPSLKQQAIGAQTSECREPPAGQGSQLFRWHGSQIPSFGQDTAGHRRRREDADEARDSKARRYNAEAGGTGCRRAEHLTKVCLAHFSHPACRSVIDPRESTDVIVMAQAFVCAQRATIAYMRAGSRRRPRRQSKEQYLGIDLSIVL